MWESRRVVAAPALIDLNGISPADSSTTAWTEQRGRPDDSDVSAQFDLRGSAGFNKLPYAGFPDCSTVAQALRPFPQFGSVQTCGRRWARHGMTRCR